jgi:hypothetical protein
MAMTRPQESDQSSQLTEPEYRTATAFVFWWLHLGKLLQLWDSNVLARTLQVSQSGTGPA